MDEEGTRQHGDLHELRVAQRHAADGTTAGGGVLMARAGIPVACPRASKLGLCVPPVLPV